MERQRIGQNAEDAAVGFLESQGLTVLLRNFRRRLGELDIVAREGDVLVIASRDSSPNAELARADSMQKPG